MNRKRFQIIMSLTLAVGGFFCGVEQGRAAPTLNPAVDLAKPNYAYSPPLRKFIDSLPGLGAGARTANTALGASTLGQYIPIATPGVLPGFPNDDYYEIALVEYHEQLHRDLPPVVGTWPNQTGGTKLRGYVQEVNGVAVGSPHYLGPLIIATKNKPVRLKFTNRLPVGAGGNLFLPVDTTIMGAGMGPLTAAGAPCDPTAPGATCASFTDNRATLHLHGGLPPWISDGTAHQWITPAGETTPFVKGASQQNVPDMPLPATGSATFYWPNQQGGRLMFYHDHALGITALNVYAGEAAGYLLSDPAEETALATAGVPGTTADLAHLIPLIIQDKTFVYDNSVTPVGVAKDSTRFTAVTDPLWDSVNWGTGGNLWFPHVYMPNQDPSSLSGANPLGRWDYGAWFWPVFQSAIPPAISHVPEAFMDTPIVNGTPYPYIDVAAAPYRLKILNAMNDRMLNLQLYQADQDGITPATATAKVVNGAITSIVLGNQGSGYIPNTSPMVHIVGGGGYGAWATATVNGLGNIASITLTNGGAGYIKAPTVTIGSSTEVKMVPAIPNAAIPFPPVWLTQTPGMIPDVLDSRNSGVPDPTLRGPAMIQIATEGGLLPGPALLPNTPVGFEQNKRNIVVLNVLEKTLFMAPAERADVVVDFTPFAGKTIILYNDSPTPVPAGDPRYDFYTGNPDYSATGGTNNQGGAPSTIPGYGPNTRTIMQFRVAGIDPAPGTPGPVDYYNPATLTALQNPTTGLPAIFKATQDAPVVPESVYNTVGYTGGATTDTFARIQDLSLTFTPYGSTVPITMPMQNKAIQELFDPQGRMNATLGVELPFTGARNQTTVPLGFIDPTTETISRGQTQLWKITHNGVDTHGIHFHLVNVQVINRVGWDGAIRPIDENEYGWKDTVRMNPLEDIIVAMRAKTPTFPFQVPDSVRLINPAMPEGSTFASLSPLTGLATTVTNSMTNFGHEYTWHCHILGHEENDMMRPLVLKMNDRIGVFRNGEWYMDANGNGAWDTGDKHSVFGATGDIPVSGDWNGNGTTKLGAYKGNGVWWLDLNDNGVLDTGETFTFGIAGDIPVVGDWTGSGSTKIGIVRNSGGTKMWYLDMNGNGIWDAGIDQFSAFGIAGDVAVTGDWNGTGKTKIGVFRNGQWYLNMTGNGVWTTPADTMYTFGIAGDVPITGDWNGTGKTKVGVFRNGQMYLNVTGNGAWTPPVDVINTFGIPGDKPVIGKW
jgi:FtsP/CotA-like multicopper oxidase with cupredoxin domain